MSSPEPTGSREQGRPRRRFGRRVVLAMLAILVAFQLAVMLAMHYSVETSVDLQLHRQLVTGSGVWAQTHDAQLEQLIERLLVLSDDFGFKQAVATGDAPTLASVLANQSERLGAQHGWLFSADGRPTADYHAQAGSLSEAPLQAELELARSEGFAAGVIALSGSPARYAIVPVFAPDLVGWLAVGERMGRESLQRLELITGLDAALLVAVGAGCQLAAAPPALAALADHEGFCASLDATGEAQEWAQLGLLQGRPLRAERLTHAGSAPVWLLLSSGREQALAPFAGLQSRALGLGLLAALVTALVASWFGARVSRPVERLADAAVRVSHGDYGSSLAVQGNDELGELARAFARMQQAIAEREGRILHQASHDALTGLPNRDQALRQLDAVLAGPVGAASQGAIVRVDIRRFDEVNDLLGQAFGDEVLVRCAARLREVVGERDLVARVGSNEFLVVMAGVAACDAQARVEALIAAMHSPLPVQRTELSIDVSAGVAIYPADATDATQLLRRSDIALAQAKQHGQVVAFYEDGREEAHLRRLRLIGDLRHAVERGELALHYQPQLALSGQRLSHAEALLRWTHPALGPIAPDEFIALAEHAGLMPGITRFVISQAMRQLAQWAEQGIDCGVAVNLSALDLLRPDLADMVLDLMQQHRIEAEALVLEVTESAVMQDLTTSIATLRRLRSAGVAIAIDDFGTGQSSLAQLKRLPVDQLKVDKSFVMGLRAGTDDEHIISSIMQLAHSLSLVVVAEGVETEEGLAVLRRHGCELAQGYLHARPMSPTHFANWWQARSELRRLQMEA